MGADSGVLVPVKIVIAGGLGAGKSTMVSTISEIEPLITEGEVSVAPVSDEPGPTKKSKTSVAMDIGRVTFEDGEIVLYLFATPADLFGTPGPDRFGFMWDDLTNGALGAIVLVDTRHIDSCFAAIDYLEARNVPFVVAVNMFDGCLNHSLGEVRTALRLHPAVPLVATDVRSKEHVKCTFLELLDTLVERAHASAAAV